MRREQAGSYRLNLPYKTQEGPPERTDLYSVNDLADMGYVGIYRIEDDE